MISSYNFAKSAARTDGAIRCDFVDMLYFFCKDNKYFLFITAFTRFNTYKRQLAEAAENNYNYICILT
ncbi:hypothetical protein GCM10009120_04960 [Sphingobacterium siyangense subsp. cladoniae]